MTRPKRPRLPDDDAREQAIGERARNIVVDAGPGTGKTYLIIKRVIEMVAPSKRGLEPVPLDRLAVLTFTRRAAGELRYRLRQELLDALRTPPGKNDQRTVQLARALASVDTAYIATIHGFADRLLRLRPVEAGISPRYELCENPEEFVRESFDRLLHAVDTGTLRPQLGDRARDVSVDAGEIQETIGWVQGAGIITESREYSFGTVAGLDAVIEKMIESRDVSYLPDVEHPDVAAITRAAKRIAAELRSHTGTTRGERLLLRVGTVLEELVQARDLPTVFRLAHTAFRLRGNYTMAKDFQGAGKAWEHFKDLRDEGEWRAEIVGPLYRWMGARLVRMREAVEQIYAQVKEERGVLDYLDLQICLRDLLVRDLDVRRYFQSLFDHLFIDEFQDTDPLQCEIVFFLAEESPKARDWRKVRLSPGKLSIVGDPKQSIYRFRRADIRMYDEAHRVLLRQGALPVAITTNFRSRPGLIEFYNGQFPGFLGEKLAEAKSPFDPETGTVLYEPIDADPAIPASAAAVHIVPYEGEGGSELKAGGGREVEAQALSRYVGWLVTDSRLRVRDPETQDERRVRYGDVAVLAHVTTNLGALLRAFEALDIQYTAHGGVLFLANPLVKRYILALRAIADASDGVAEAAFMCPPFFALDLADVVSPRVDDAAAASIASSRDRLVAAREIVREIRRGRLGRPPIDTAIEVIERTSLGRAVAVGPNGPQALQTLYEVALQVGRMATQMGLDYDGVTREMREWVEGPIPLEPPDASGPETVRVMTIHQAKGLEFPVVVMWDGFASVSGRVDTTWVLSRNADGVALSVDGLKAELPTGEQLRETEKMLASAERQRLFFVAMTRARDLLVVPEPKSKRPGGLMLRKIMAGADTALVKRLETFRPDVMPGWAREGEEGTREIVADEAVGARIEKARTAFGETAVVASEPRAMPTAVTEEARAAARGGEAKVQAAEQAEAGAEVVGAEGAPAGPADQARGMRNSAPGAAEGDTAPETQRERLAKSENSRFGAVFGSTVHRALQLVLQGAAGSVPELVALAAREHGLTDHLAEAREDVGRALECIGSLTGTAVAGAGGGSTRPVIQVEYPLCLAVSGKLLLGTVDLLVATDAEVLLIDFKTDAPPGRGSSLDVYPSYRRQLELYGEAVQITGLLGARVLRQGLLFTGSGTLLWAKGL